MYGIFKTQNGHFQKKVGHGWYGVISKLLTILWLIEIVDIYTLTGLFHKQDIWEGKSTPMGGHFRKRFGISLKTHVFIGISQGSSKELRFGISQGSSKELRFGISQGNS